MKRPRVEDFEKPKQDCWGAFDSSINLHDFAIALNKYIDYLESQIKK